MKSLQVVQIKVGLPKALIRKVIIPSAEEMQQMMMQRAEYEDKVNRGIIR